MRVAGYVVGTAIVVLSMATQAMAGFNAAPVPEIDAGSIAGGLGLLAGAVLIARARWRSR